MSLRPTSHPLWSIWRCDGCGTQRRSGISRAVPLGWRRTIDAGGRELHLCWRCLRQVGWAPQLPLAAAVAGGGL